MKKARIDNLATFALFTLICGRPIVIEYETVEQARDAMKRLRNSLDLLLQLMRN